MAEDGRAKARIKSGKEKKYGYHGKEKKKRFQLMWGPACGGGKCQEG